MSNRSRQDQRQEQPRQYVRGAGGQPVPVYPMMPGGPVHVRGPMPPPGTQIVVQAGPPQGQAMAAYQQMEQKLAVQHGEFQQLLTENQRLAATHVALRQELAAAQGEIQRLKQVMGEKDVGLRQLAEKSAKMEADLRGTDMVKHELQAARLELQSARGELQSMVGRRQELEAARAAQAGQMQQMQADMQRMRQDLQQVPAMRKDIDTLQQELAMARDAMEYEKKTSEGLQVERKAMESNLVSMARDVERLKAELANASKQGPQGTTPMQGYGGYGGGAAMSYGGPYGYGGGDGYSAAAQAYGGQMYMAYGPGPGAGGAYGPGAGAGGPPAPPAPAYSYPAQQQQHSSASPGAKGTGGSRK